MEEETSQQHDARDFGDGVDVASCPQSERMQELNERSFHYRHWPVLRGSPLSTMLQQGKRSLPPHSPDLEQSLNHGFTTRNGLCRKPLAPFHRSLR